MELINKRDAQRIAADADIAIDCLLGITYSADNLHPEYLREKVECAQRCLDFMKHFYTEEKK